MAAVIYLSHLESVARVACVTDQAKTSQNTFSSVSLTEMFKVSLCLKNNFHGNLFSFPLCEAQRLSSRIHLCLRRLSS